MKIYPTNTLEKLGFEYIREAVLQRVRSDVAREWVEGLQPVSVPGEVRRRLMRTREAMQLLAMGLKVPVEELEDVRGPLDRARAERSVLDAQSLLHIGSLLAATRRAKQFFAQHAEVAPAWQVFSVELIPMKPLEDEISRVLTEHGNVKDAASPELAGIRKNLASRRNDLRSTLAKVLRQAAKDGYLSENEATIRGGRMVLAIKAEHKRKINGFIHDTSGTGQTVYLEPVEVLHVNNDIRQLETDEAREIERILMALTARVRDARGEIRQNALLMGELDAGFAIARLSAHWDGVVPEVAVPEGAVSESGGEGTSGDAGGGRVASSNRAAGGGNPGRVSAMFGEDRRLRTARFRLERTYNAQLLLKSLSVPGSPEVVPLDLILDENERCVVITGPNAGGKSVALKTIGLTGILVQCGFAVPLAEGSCIPLFGSVFVDLGDEQSIESDLSTFSSRLTWMREVVAASAPDSLVLIDEAGTGTDPEEGVALYQALIEQLIARKCITVVTTHHGNLKVFAHDHPETVNASMEFGQDTLSPTYRFRKGMPGSSYAFEIAQRTGVQAGILERARALLGETRNRLEHLIADLERERQVAADAKRDMEAKLREAEKLMEAYEQRMQSIGRDRDRIREKALTEARSIMESANRQVEEAVRLAVEEKAREIEAAGGRLVAGSVSDGSSGDVKKGKVIGRIRRELDETRREIGRQLDEISSARSGKVTGVQPLPGDRVRLAGGDTTGELVEINGENAVVLSGGLRLRTKLRNLERVEKGSSGGKGKKSKSGSGGGKGQGGSSGNGSSSGGGSGNGGEFKAPGVRIFLADADEGMVRAVSPRLDVRGQRGDEAIKELTHFIDRALMAGLHEVEIIHGKGDGILRKLVQESLRKRPEIASVEQAPWEQGGPGCTIAKIKS